MKNRMMGGVAAVLLIGSFFVAGCGPTKESQRKSRELAASVCAGNDAKVPAAAPYTKTSGFHPIEYFLLQGTQWNTTSSYWSSENLDRRADGVAKVELVACVVEEYDVLERCPYALPGGKQGTVSRLQVKTVVTLREAQTGKVVATSEAVMGDVPLDCEKTVEFPEGSTSKSIIGSRPSKDVNAWLKQYVEIP
jgi:hypothetical protein